MKCPLCNNDAKVEQYIDTASLINLWNKFGADVSNLFNGDHISKCLCENCGLGFFLPFSPGDNSFYSKLSEWDWYYKHDGKTEYKLASNLIMPGSRVIDVGCGIGEFSEYLDDSIDFHGVELSSKSVEIAKILGRKVDQVNIIDAPESFRCSYDYVTCFQVLEHISDIHLFFTALVSLCKNDGIIVLAVPDNDGFVGGAVNNIFNMPPHHLLLWNFKSIDYLARRYNLQLVHYIREPLSDIHRHWAYSIKVMSFFNKKLFHSKRSSVVNTEFYWRVIVGVSSVIGRFLNIIRPNLVDTGHSAIVVLKKI